MLRVFPMEASSAWRGVITANRVIVFKLEFCVETPGDFMGVKLYSPGLISRQYPFV